MSNYVSPVLDWIQILHKLSLGKAGNISMLINNNIINLKTYTLNTIILDKKWFYNFKIVVKANKCQTKLEYNE